MPDAGEGMRRTTPSTSTPGRPRRLPPATPPKNKKLVAVVTVHQSVRAASHSPTRPSHCHEVDAGPTGGAGRRGLGAARHQRPGGRQHQGQRLLEGHAHGRDGGRAAGRLRQGRRRRVRQVPRAQCAGPGDAQGLLPGVGVHVSGAELVRGRRGRRRGRPIGGRRPGGHGHPLPAAPRRARAPALGRARGRVAEGPRQGAARHQARLRRRRRRRRQQQPSRRGPTPQGQGQAAQDDGAYPGVHPAQGHDPHPAGHRRARPQGVERAAAQLLLLRHRNGPGHLPAVQEDRERPGARLAALGARRPLGRPLCGGARLRGARGRQRGRRRRRRRRLPRRRSQPRLPGALADYNN